MVARPPSRNYQKHTNPNPLQRWLIRRFHERIAEMLGQALGIDASPDHRRGTGRTVLDVGCGEGFVAAYLQDRFPNLTILGVDIDFRFLGTACTGRAYFVGADARALPFSEETFDLVLCLEVLEHLEKPREALAELARVSRGLVLLSVPHQPFFSLANLLRGKNLTCGGDDPDHRHRWRPGQFLALLEGMGRVERLTYAFPWVIALVRKGSI